MSHKQYHAVWVYIVPEDPKKEPFWGHHISCDSRSDALEEARSQRNSGYKTEIRRQDW